MKGEKMKLEKLKEEGFDFMQVNILMQFPDIKALVFLKPNASVQSLRKLKIFLNEHITTNEVNKILVKAVNEGNDAFLDYKPLSTIKDFSSIKDEYASRAYKCFIAGLDMSQLDSNITVKELDLYKKYKKAGKDILTLLGRGFNESQISVLSDYLSYDLSKFESKFTVERISFFCQCLKHGIDPFDRKEDVSINRHDIYLKAKLKNIDLSEYSDVNPNGLKYLLEISSKTRRKTAGILLKKGYSVNKTKCLLELLDEKIDIAKYEKITDTNILKAVVNFARCKLHNPSLIDKMLDMYDEVEYSTLINAYADLEDVSKQYLFEKFLEKKMSTSQILIASTAISYGQMYEALFEKDFSSDQFFVLDKYIKEGVDISPILNEKFSSEVMEATMLLTQHGVKLDFTNFSYEQLKERN